MRHAKTVFVLGAGASRMSGGPLMSDFIERADVVRQDQESDGPMNILSENTSVRQKLQRAYARANLDIDNIEDLLSAYETAHLLGRLDTEPVEKIAQLSQDLRFIMMRTLEHSIQFSILVQDEIVFAPEPFDAFVELLEQLLNRHPSAGPITVVSFNYDLSLDYAIRRKNLSVSYGFDRIAAELTLLKLHGSLSWSLDPSGHIQMTPVRPLDSYSQLRWRGLDDSAFRPISTMELMYDGDFRARRPAPEPFIAPPTWNKQPYGVTLTPIWRQASEAISNAENVIVIGFSLSPADQFFRAFWALSCIADAITERFWVFDPWDGVRDRYEKLLGPAILSRKRFRWFPTCFDESIKLLALAFNLKTEPISLLENRLAPYRRKSSSATDSNA